MLSVIMASVQNVDTSSSESGGEDVVPGFGEGTISGEPRATGVGENGAVQRLYAWENVGEEDEDMAALKRELEEQVDSSCPRCSPSPAGLLRLVSYSTCHARAPQEKMLEEHQSLLSGNEAELETMIKDLRKELQGSQVRRAAFLRRSAVSAMGFLTSAARPSQESSWRLDQAAELDDMKECLINTVYARANRWAPLPRPCTRVPPARRAPPDAAPFQCP